MSDELNNNLAVIPLDFFKTFDRVDSDFISMFGYGDKFIHMIEVACTNLKLM